MTRQQRTLCIAKQDFRLLPTAISALLGAWLGIYHWERWTGINIYLMGLCAVLLFFVLAYAAFHIPFCGKTEIIARHLLLACAVMLISTATSIFHCLDSHPDLPVELTRTLLVKGEVVTRTHEDKNGSCSVDVEVTRMGEEGKSEEKEVKAIRVKVRAIPCSVLQGQYVQILGKAKTAEKQEKHALTLYARGVKVVGEGRLSARIVSTMDRALNDALEGKKEHLRGLVPGVALGKTSNLSAELRQAMKSSQLLHLIAVSGGHVSIIVGLTLIVVGLRNRIITALICFILLYFLIVLVGPDASVIRAAIMAVLVCCGIGCGRSTQSLPALCLAVLVVSFIDPWLTTTYGFLLSCSATLGIVVIGEPLSSRIEHQLPEKFGSCAYILGQALGIPLAAQLACTPVLAFLTDTGSLWGLVANVLVAPVVAPLTLCGLMATVISPLTLMCAHLFLIPAGMASWWIASVALHVDALPGNDIPLVLATCGCLTLLLFFFLNARRSIAFLSFVFAIASFLPAEGIIDQQWIAIQCDVGQGSAFLARVKNKIIMIDTGPPDGKVGECLKKASVTHIDILVITHSHEDHVGGISEVFHQAKVKEVWTSPNTSPHKNWEEVKKKCLGTSTTMKKVHAGEKEEGIEIIWPTTKVSGGEAQANEESLALYLDILGGIVVMGDQGKEAQEQIKEKIAKVNFLVVAHHGSANQSPSFAQKLDPAVALVSVGENTYGHPSRKIWNLYSKAQVYTTKECGTLVLTKDSVVSSCEK